MKKKPMSSTERLLISRLRYMGYALLLFSIGFFFYALETPKTSATLNPNFLPEEELSAFIDLSPYDTFNFFIVSSVFAALGIFCLVTAYKNMRKKQ
jgi:hypothetical protein